MSVLSRRDVLRGAAGAAASLAAGCASARDAQQASGPDAEARRPNLIVLFGDEWRGDALGCAGNPDVRTPHVDRLAAGGLRFENAFVNAPVCSPARAQMLTGLYPLATGVLTNNMRLAPGLATLPRLLNARGYRCRLRRQVAPQRLVEPRPRAAGPLRAGFDDFWAVWGRPHRYFDSWYRRDGEEKLESPGYAGHHQTDVALEYLEEKAKGDDPFALFLSWGPPHTPHEAPREFRALYDAAALTFAPTVAEADRDPEALAQYYAACTALDADLGRIEAALERLGLAADTVVVFTSDHGWHFGEHGVVGKQTPFDASIRIPMIARVPGRHEAGSVSDSLFTMADFAPTVLSWMGVEPPEGLQGLDLSSGTGGPDSAYLLNVIGIGRTFDSDVFTWRGVRTRTHLYAEDRGGPWLLYDVEADPHQATNLVGKDSHAALQRELAAELRRWYERLGEAYRTPIQHLADLGRSDFLDDVEAMYSMIPEDSAARYRAYFADGGDWENRRF